MIRLLSWLCLSVLSLFVRTKRSTPVPDWERWRRISLFFAPLCRLIGLRSVLMRGKRILTVHPGNVLIPCVL